MFPRWIGALNWGWLLKTLPVAAIGHNAAEVQEVGPLVEEACARVRAGQHDAECEYQPSST